MMMESLKFFLIIFRWKTLDLFGDKELNVGPGCAHLQ